MSNQAKLQRALRLNEERANKTFTRTFKFPEGATDIRILPASKQDDSDEWFLPIGQHYGLDKFPVFCPYETDWAEDDCPVCDIVRELRQDASMDDEAKNLSVSRSYFVRAIVRGEEEEGPQVVRLPSTLFTAIGEFMKQEDTFGSVLNPSKKGHDIRVSKTGKQLNTKYTAMVLPKARIALTDVPALKKMLADLGPIADLVDIPSTEDLDSLVKEKLGFSASALGSSGDEDDGLLDTDNDGDTTDEFDLDFNGEDDEDEVGDDVPFDEDEAEDETSTDSSDDDEDLEDDDSWMSDDEDDDDLTADLAAALADDDAPVVEKKTKKRGKTRAKK